MFDLKILLLALALLSIAPSGLQADAKSELKQIDKSIRIRDYSLAVQQLKPLLNSGNPDAQFMMAGLYRSGRGVEKDLDQAMRLYEEAAKNGHADAQYTLASLLEKRGEASQAEFWYLQAAEQGQKQAQTKLKASIGSKYSTKDLNEEKVFSAIIHNDISQIRSLIESEYEFDIQDNSKRSPLIAALLAENKEIAELLLPVTHNLRHADQDQNQAIHVAAAKGYANMVKQLIDRGVDINSKDNLGNSPLVIAIRHDDAALTRLLLKHKADYNLKNNRKVSAIQLAQTRADPGVLKAFRDQGIKVDKKQTEYADVSIKDFEKSIQQSSSVYKGWPILSIASLLGEDEIVKQLLRQGADVNKHDQSGYTALHRASSKGQANTVGLLLASGAMLDALNENKETPLYLAAESGNLKTVKKLIQSGADTALLASNKTSALAVAITNNHPDIALELAGQNLDSLSIHSALYLAIQKDMESVSLKLIARDKLINELDNNKRSLLWYSADGGRQKVTAAILLNKSVDINQKDVKGFCPLSRSVLKGHSNISKMLIGMGADIQVLTSEKNTMLMHAVISGDRDMVKFLIDKKIDIDAKNNSGETALMLAAGAGDQPIVELLIESGADIQTRNQDDLSAYEIAVNAGKKDTAEYIRNKSGRLFKLFN